MITKTELIQAVAADTGETQRTVQAVLSSIEAQINQAMKNKDEINLGFMKFKTTDKPARMGRNPKTGEPQEVSARTVPKAVIGKALKDAANGGKQ